MTAASVPIPKFAVSDCGRNRDTSSLFSVACLSQKCVVKDDELLGQGTTRRIVLGAGLAALATPALAQARTPLTVMVYGGGYEKAIREKVVPEFEAANPYAVTVVVADDTLLVPRLVSARTRSPFDAICCNEDAAILLRANGLLAADQSAHMPELADTYESMKPPRTVIYGNTVYRYDFVYRTTAFAAAPTSWQDLWKPGITVGVPAVSQAYGMTFLYIAALLNGGSATNLEPGFAAIRRLGKVKIYKNVSQGLTLFQQGEIDAALYYAHRGQQLIDSGLPLARVQPKEGAYAQRTGTQIPKGTTNMAGAIAWVRTSLSPLYQGALLDQLYSPSNRKVPIPAGQENKYISGDAVVAALLDPPWAELLPQKDAVLDRWTRELG